MSGKFLYRLRIIQGLNLKSGAWYKEMDGVDTGICLFVYYWNVGDAPYYFRRDAHRTVWGNFSLLYPDFRAVIYTDSSRADIGRDMFLRQGSI